MKRYGWPLLGVVLLILALIISILIQTASTINLTGQVTASSRVNITPQLPSNCNFNLITGRNEVSFYCIANGQSVEDTVGDINFNYIFKYDANDVEDPWKVVNTNLPNYAIEDLTTFDRASGYIIDVSNNTNYFYAGNKKTPNDIPIYAGWNLVGYPNNITQIIPDILTTINGSYTIIYSYNNTQKGYNIHYPPNTGNLTTANAYSAFWIYATTTDTWTVP